MNPRLIAISGSSKGMTFHLSPAETSVGREPSNTVHLNELSVSRRHCLIRSERLEDAKTAGQSNEPDELTGQSSAPGSFTIKDLDSYNGTFVNGVPVNEHPLKHGDQIAVGDALLLFLADDAETEVTLLPQAVEGDLITRSTIRLQREDALYLRPEKIVAELAQSDRVGHDLNTLLKISKSIGTLRSRSELQAYLLEAIREVIPAERQAIVLADPIGDQSPSIYGWSKLTGPADSIKPSQTITGQVWREGIALLSNDLFAESDTADRASLAEANVCSVLCVPLIVLERTIGVIYLDTSNPSTRFDESHLQLLTAIAGIAAVAFENTRHVETLQDENQRLRQESKVEHQMVGESEPLRAVERFISKVAPADSTVLIGGESGTGKELAARAIHLNGPRATKPFIAINCATLSDTLIETELFGHEKGAFTGAIAQKRGKLELADGGTLFLDEVAELSSAIQAKLLRVLQEREFERLGGTRSIKVDVRIIAATNQDLESAVRAKQFREDLYYRLNVVSVVMPALRTRRQDIPLLASYFVSIYGRKCKRRVLGVSPQARELLQSYDWPGNVRELENAVERAVVLGSTETIIPEDLPDAVFEGSRSKTSIVKYQDKLKAAKKLIVLKAIEEANGSYAEAARQLGLHATNLHRLIRNLDIKGDLKK